MTPNLPKAYIQHNNLNRMRSVRLVAYDAASGKPLPGVTEIIYDRNDDRQIDEAYYCLMSAAARLGYYLELASKGEVEE